MQELIRQRFGFQLPIRTMGEYIKRWGYTPQRPIHRAYQQKPEAVRQWLENKYPCISMKVAAVEQVEAVSDVLCDVCGDSTRVEGYGLQFGTLRASWGFGSAHDGERYEVHLCESCFSRTLASLRRERMVNTMFSDGDEDLSNFGCVARDDFFNDGGSSAP